MSLHGHNDLKVYKLAYKLAMQIFQHSKGFPQEKRYSLTDQIRRSSRSVCANIAEGFRKRRYPGMFVSKLALAAQGTRAVRLGWDTAAWHTRQSVRPWMRGHQQQGNAFRAGGWSVPGLPPRQHPWLTARRSPLLRSKEVRTWLRGFSIAM